MLQSTEAAESKAAATKKASDAVDSVKERVMEVKKTTKGKILATATTAKTTTTTAPETIPEPEPRGQKILLMNLERRVSDT